MNQCKCYLKGPESNIVHFAIKLTTPGVGEVRLASPMRLFDPPDVALQLSFLALVSSKTFFLFDSTVATLRLFGFSGSGSFNENFAHP